MMVMFGTFGEFVMCMCMLHIDTSHDPDGEE
jgi:hypothetical protein